MGVVEWGKDLEEQRGSSSSFVTTSVPMAVQGLKYNFQGGGTILL